VHSGFVDNRATATECGLTDVIAADVNSDDSVGAANAPSADPLRRLLVIRDAYVTLSDLIDVFTMRPPRRVAVDDNFRSQERDARAPRAFNERRFY